MKNTISILTTLIDSLNDENMNLNNTLSSLVRNNKKNDVNPNEVETVISGRASLIIDILDQKILSCDSNEIKYGVNRIDGESGFKLTEKNTVFIGAGVPYHDVGGGQRSAQLARTFLNRGWNVVYLYIYPEYDVNTGEALPDKPVTDFCIHGQISNYSLEYLKRLMKSSDLALIEVPHPNFLDLFDTANKFGIRTVFELIDHWDSSLGGDWFSSDTQDKFTIESTVAVGTAKVLVNELKKIRDDVLYLPNAADERIFNPYLNYGTPWELESSKSVKRCIYIGSLYGEWFDWEALSTAAEKNPNLEFIVIGEVPSKFVRKQNIKYLGKKQNSELAGYLASADFAICPFKPGKISDAVSPIKVFEYLSMHRPVIATGLPEIKGYPAVIMAKSASEFSDTCEQFVLGKIKFKRQEIEEFVYKNSWNSRIDAFSSKGIYANYLVSLIILTHNNEACIERCLSSLTYHLHGYNVEIVVVDNMSSDKTIEIIEKYDNVKLVKNSVNGCSTGRNLGVQSCSGEIIVFFDSDQWVTSSAWYDEAIYYLTKFPSIGCISWAAGWFGPECGPGPVAEHMKNKARNNAYKKDGFRVDVGYLGSGGMCVRKKLFEEIGGFDVYYDPTAFEDTDFSFKIKEAGYFIAYREFTGICHQAHQTTKASAQSNEYRVLFKRNKDYFLMKWKNKIGYFKELIEDE